MAFEYFPVPDNPSVPRGPVTWAKQLWIEEMPYEVRKEKAHFHHTDIAICLAGINSGKCCLKGTFILMVDGSTKKVEDVVVGDLLLGPDGRSRKVVSLCSGIDQMFQVKPPRGKGFVCNSDHILSLKTSGFRIWKDGKESYSTGETYTINIKDFIPKSKHFKNQLKLYKPDKPLEFESNGEELILDPYYLGLWLGDGDSNGSAITNPDPEILAYIEQFACIEGARFTYGVSKTDKCSKIHLATHSSIKQGLNSNPVTEKMRRLELIQNKHIPKPYLLASVENRYALLAGLLDTDGYLSKDSYFEIVQKNELLANQIVFLSRSLGFATEITKKTKSCPTRSGVFTGEYFLITICGAIHKIPNKVTRKQAKVNAGRNSLVQGFTVEPYGEGEYYGFTLEGPDALFLLDDFTVVHNSLNTAARGVHVARKWKNGRLIIGAMNYPVLERAQVNHWADIFAWNGSGMPWGHKEIRRRMTDKRKWIELTNGTIVYFLNLELWQTVKSIPAGFILVEEANTLKSPQSYFELLGRFRAQTMPLHQMVLLANPRVQGNWMSDTFNLKQFQPGYEGPRKPIGKPCKCQYCPVCMNVDHIDVEWEDNECPRCGVVNDREKKIYVCRNCKSTKRKLVKYDGLQCADCGWYKCPGDQYFHRYIPSNILDNQFADDATIETLRATMSPLQFQLLGEGKILDTNIGNIHVSWKDSSNILPEDIAVDLEKDINWCQDFNNDPMSTVLAQVYTDLETGNPNIVCFDEIITFRSTVYDSVKVFAERYSDFTGKVIVWGDPAGYNNRIEGKVKDRYEQLADAFEEFQINYEIRAIKQQSRILARLDTLNWHLRSANGYVRLKVNPRCVWTVESIRGCTWNKDGTAESNRNDRNCAKKAFEGTIPPGVPDKDVQVLSLTHPQAALGYWLLLEFPQVEYAIPTHWHTEPDGTIVNFKDEQIIERRITDPAAMSLDNFNPNKYSLDSIIKEDWDRLSVNKESESRVDSIFQNGLWGF